MNTISVSSYLLDGDGVLSLQYSLAPDTRAISHTTRRHPTSTSTVTITATMLRPSAAILNLVGMVTARGGNIISHCMILYITHLRTVASGDGILLQTRHLNLFDELQLQHSTSCASTVTSL